MFGRLGLALAAIAAAFAITGAGTHQPQSGGPENPAAAHAVAVVTGMTDGGLATAMPADFADVMGYEPVETTGPGGRPILVKPTGDCSSPFGATIFGFTRACKQHDLGYDLLRYAGRTGGELGPWARRAIDGRLAAAMDEHCAASSGGPACHAMVRISDNAVRANSWRQGQGVPGREEGAPYAVAGALIAAAIAGPPLARRLRSQPARGRPFAAAKGVPSR